MGANMMRLQCSLFCYAATGINFADHVLPKSSAAPTDRLLQYRRPFLWRRARCLCGVANTRLL